ncbi:MAG: hypothetical protein HY703_10155 [Gemmatimonadetes bacterium]|nr:hypothetical protein [Gemmatimonadota bacterium]
MARRAGPFWVLIAVLVVGHFTLYLALGLGAAGPDLLTVALLLGARRLRGATAAGLGLALGVLEDALSLQGFGAAAIALTLVGYLGARSRDLFVGDSLLFLGFYLFVGKWLHDAVYDLFAGPAAAGGGAGGLLIDAPLAALYASGVAVAALLLYRVVVGRH